MLSQRPVMNPKNDQNVLLLYGVQFVLLVVVGRIQEVLPFLSGLHIGKIALLLAVVIYLITPRPQGHVSPRQFPQVRIISFIYLLCLFSIPFSVWGSLSFRHAVLQFPMTLLLFYLLIYVVNDARYMEKIIWTFISSVSLLAIFTVILSGGGRSTSSSTYDPNDIAILFVITLPLIYFFMSARRGLIKVLLLGLLLTVLAALIATVSRGGFLGLMVIIPLIVFRDKYRSWKTKIVVSAFLGIVFIQMAPDSYWERMQTILTYEQDYNSTSKAGRMALWTTGAELMLQNPVTGIGTGAVYIGVGQSYGDEGGRWLTVHNAYIQIGAELGVGGLILFIALILTCFYQLRKLRLKYATLPGVCHDYLWLITALEISLVGYCVTAMFISAAYFAMFYVLVALCCILQKLDYLSSNQNNANGINEQYLVSQA